ncbi:MAG: pyruvate formate lyase family protein [Lachnospiraceae bacterium]|jgi:pyruvate-formate lyase
MNNFKVKNPRTDLSFEIAFTKAYRDAVKKYTHPAQIELACLRAQYPAILHPIQDEDVLAGRVQAGLVGLGIQGQTGGYGYYIDEPRVTAALEKETGDAKYREDIHDLLIFWKTNSSNNKVLRSTPDSIKNIIFSDNWKETPLPASPIIRMAGAYLDFDKLIWLGLPGMKKEASEYAKKAEENGGDVILFECMAGAIELMQEVCLWYEKQARELILSAPTEKRRNQLEKMADALKGIAVHEPSSMLEALQLVWIYGIMAPLLQFGRMDEYLGDWYVHDIDNGIITEEEALEMIQSYFRQIDSLDSETDCRVIIGGYGRRNPENADRLCLVAAEACRTVKEILPQFTLRFNKETPKAVWDACMRCIVEGRTFPLLYNDDVLVPSVMKAFGVDRKLAETYMPLGCGEIEFDHYSFGTPSGSLNTLKILELAVRGGYEPIMDWHLGCQLKPLEECESFEEFLDIYKANLEYYIQAQAVFEKYEYEITGKMHSFMYVSMLYDGVMDSGKAIFDGGCQYLAGTLELYGVVNAVNSLAAVKKLVFEEKTISAKDLHQAMDDNFYGWSALRKQLLDVPKYGNDVDEVDQIFVQLQDWICETIRRQAEKVGLASYLAVNINNKQNTTLGRWVGATPDGRKAGMPMANANNPSSGTDKNGITAMLNSILKPHHDNHAGMVQNLRISRETFEADYEKTEGLIKNYFDRGGAHLMITVVGREDLKNAMEHPEDYPDLMVRVGGLSARFVELNKDVQQEIYDRTTY